MKVAIAQAVEFDDGHIGIKVRNRRALIVSRDEARRIWHDLASILGESEDEDDRR